MRMSARTLLRKITERKFGTYISSKSYVGKDVTLEGNNYVAENTVLASCDVGYMTYFSSGCEFRNTSFGKYCSVGPKCQVITGEHPTRKYVSTFPAFYVSHRDSGPCYVKHNKFQEYRYADEKKLKNVIVGNDVWLSSNVMIMEGVKIGDGAVVGAGALVTKDIPPYAVAVGVPARVIRYRFPKEQTEWLLRLKWWNKDEEWVIKHAEEFEDIQLFMKKIAQEENQ